MHAGWTMGDMMAAKGQLAGAFLPIRLFHSPLDEKDPQMKSIPNYKELYFFLEPLR